MPTYYFDVYDNETLRPDDFGIELEDLYDARTQAIALLSHITGDAIPEGDHHAFKVVVRCQSNRVRYIATLTLDGAWVEPPIGSEAPPISMSA